MMHWQLRSVCQVLVKKCTETHPFLKKSTFQRWFFLTARPRFFLFGVSVTTFTRFIRELEMVSEMFWRVLEEGFRATRVFDAWRSASFWKTWSTLFVAKKVNHRHEPPTNHYITMTPMTLSCLERSGRATWGTSIMMPNTRSRFFRLSSFSQVATELNWFARFFYQQYLACHVPFIPHLEILPGCKGIDLLRAEAGGFKFHRFFNGGTSLPILTKYVFLKELVQPATRFLQQKPIWNWECLGDGKCSVGLRSSWAAKTNVQKRVWRHSLKFFRLTVVKTFSAEEQLKSLKNWDHVKVKQWRYIFFEYPSEMRL